MWWGSVRATESSLGTAVVVCKHMLGVPQTEATLR